MTGPTSTGTQTARSRASAFRDQEARRARRRRLGIGAIVAVAVLLVAALVAVVAVSLAGAPQAGPEGMVLEQGAVLAGNTTSTSGATVDGVQCGSSEQSATHIHAHLAVYVAGRLRPVPAAIGIVRPVATDSAGDFFGTSTGCYYWLHVHAQDGVIHVEAPAGTSFTLGQFFAVWQQPLSSTEVAGAKGSVTAYVDGKRVTGDPSAIRLTSRESIQLDVGSDEPWHAVDWSQSQL